jgi:hypothetical protein
VKSVTRKLRIVCTWAAAVMGLVLGTTVDVKADIVVYATADNGVTNLFGTMDLTTGQFSQIATTTPLFGSLTAGTGGTLYGSAVDSNLYTISPSGAPSQFGTVTSPASSLFPGFLGLASEGAAGFFADSVTAPSSSPTAPATATLYHISADGTTSSVVGTMGTTLGSYNSGNLAFGPNGQLYFNCWNANTNQVPTLFAVNTTTGALTQIGSNLGTTDPLALVTVGGTLYGIDTFAPTNPSIYTINTTTGVATLIGSVSGLPTGYTLDTVASVPEPSALTLLVAGGLGVLWLSRRARSRN